MAYSGGFWSKKYEIWFRAAQYEPSQEVRWAKGILDQKIRKNIIFQYIALPETYFSTLFLPKNSKIGQNVFKNNVFYDPLIWLIVRCQKT